jgi:hypothetical protein
MLARDYDVPLNEIRREHRVVNSRFVASIAPAFNIEDARASEENLQMQTITSLFI